MVLSLPELNARLSTFRHTAWRQAFFCGGVAGASPGHRCIDAGIPAPLAHARPVQRHRGVQRRVEADVRDGRVLFCQRVLERNMSRGGLDRAPVYDDVCTLTAARLKADGVRAPVVITGGFPCQDISIAGTRVRGLRGDRSGLFSRAWSARCPACGTSCWKTRRW